MSRHEIVNPQALGAPKGYANGVLARPGRLLFIAGQIAWDETQTLVSDQFADQFGQALSNVVTVVTAAGGQPEDLCRLTMYVTDKAAYLDDIKTVGAKYREILGKHFPAMALVEVKALLEDGALVEIEGTAVIPQEDR